MLGNFACFFESIFFLNLLVNQYKLILFVCADALHPSQQFFSHFGLFVRFDSLRPINNLSVKQGRVFLG